MTTVFISQIQSGKSSQTNGSAHQNSAELSQESKWAQLPPVLGEKVLSLIQNYQDYTQISQTCTLWTRFLLSDIDLSGYPSLGDDQLIMIIKLLKAKAALKHAKTHSISLAGCHQITERGLKALSDLPIHSLNLGGCRIMDQGIKALKNLPQLTNVTLGCYVPTVSLDVRGWENPFDGLSHVKIEYATKRGTSITKKPLPITE